MRKHPKHSFMLAVVLLLAISSPFAGAAVSAEEAARLQSDLTPLGAEKAGNKEGTIPAWNGGYTKVWPGYKSGQPRPDPFADEKPLLQITAKNMEQYVDKLSEGVKALLQRFPTYRLDVYPTHRTAAAPQWVYDNTFKNATRAKTTHNEVSIEGAYGGIPFPIPKTGAEVMWNQANAWKGETFMYGNNSYVVSGGRLVQASTSEIILQLPYYDRNGTLENFTGLYSQAKLIMTSPPSRVGEILLVHEPVDQYGKGGRSAWQYLVGQRRVRRAPTIAYDTPNSLISGLSFFDEVFIFNGALDRYDWKLLGKKEVFVPYNTNGFHSKKIAEVLGPHHVNPDHVRWELHRVWIVEAQLAAGKSHVMPRRRIYLDEDTWLPLLAEGWNAKGQLWHVSHSLPVIVPELPAVVAYPHFIYDLIKGAYEAGHLYNEVQPHHKVIPRKPESYFSPEALAGEGIR